MHALLFCPYFKNERENVLDFISNLYPNFRIMTDIEKLHFMLISEDECLQKVCKYIHKILSFNRPSDKKVVKK